MIRFKQIDSSLNDRMMLEIHVTVQRYLAQQDAFKDFSTGRFFRTGPQSRPADLWTGSRWPFWTRGEGEKDGHVVFGSGSSCTCFEKGSFTEILRHSCVQESMEMESDCFWSWFLAQIAATIMCAEKKHIYDKWHLHSYIIYVCTYILHTGTYDMYT